MTKGRIETSPLEQLVALYEARDRYAALADRLQSEADTSENPEEKWEREQDARRIAQAYEKSIANMIASCRNRQIELHTSTSFGQVLRLATLSLLVAGAAAAGFFAFAHPAAHRTAAAYAQADTVATKNPLAVPSTESRISPGSASVPDSEKEQMQDAAPAASKADTRRVEQNSQLAQPIATPERARNPRRAGNRFGRAARDAEPAGRGRGGFFVKVIQDDGSFKDEYFPAPAQRNF
jgi:hypothetical protein